MTNIKVSLNNIFPVGLCDEICKYNRYCFKCKDLNLKENEFQKELRRGKHLTTSEKQILFFKTEIPTPLFLSNTNRSNIRQMKREIDVLLDTYKLKQEFKHDKLFLMAITVSLLQKGSGKLPITSLKTFTTFHI